MNPTLAKPVPTQPKIRLTWNIHWSCNYRCSYCFFDAQWGELAKRNVYKTVDEWMVHWRRIHERYGQAYILINGGEPFTYPNFVELIYRLSQIHWPINISTNTSLHLEEFMERIDPEKVSLSLSFHPQYHEVGAFVEKVRWVRSKGFKGCNNFVAYPPSLDALPAYVEKFRAIGESLKVIPFVGEFEGVRYPEGYAEEHKRAMHLTDQWIDHKRHKGMLCRAGHQSGLILPDGNVARCGQIGDRQLVGHFFDERFKFADEPQPCDVEFCPCDEWKVIPDEKAPDQPGAWLP